METPKPGELFFNQILLKIIYAFLENDKEKIEELITLFGDAYNIFSEEDNRYLRKYFVMISILPSIFSNYINNSYNIYFLKEELDKSKFFRPGNELLKLLFFVIQFLIIEAIFSKESPNVLESYILYIKRTFEDFKKRCSLKGEKELGILKILDNKFNFILLKLDLLVKEKIDGIDISALSTELDKTSYKDIKNILIYYSKDSHININDIIKIYLKDIGKKEKTSVDYYFLVKYYKDEDSNTDELEKLYNEYLEINKCDFNKIKNIIFIGNNLLSHYSNINKGLEDEKIEKLYTFLDKKQKSSNYYNYFTYLKYAEYNIKLLGNYLEKLDLKKGNEILEKLEYFNKHIKSIYESNSYFEIPDDENFIDNDIEILKKDLPKIYSPNLIKIGEKYNSDFRIEKLSSKIEYLKFILIQNQSLEKQIKGYNKQMKEEFDNNRNKQIEVLAIFSAIVLFVSGSIQLYTRLSDLESAIIFTLFFAGVISIMLSLVFRTKSYIKWVNFGVGFLLILLGSLFSKYSEDFGFVNRSLNINQIEENIKILDGKVKEYENNKKEINLLKQETDYTK